MRLLLGGALLCAACGKDRATDAPGRPPVDAAAADAAMPRPSARLVDPGVNLVPFASGAGVYLKLTATVEVTRPWTGIGTLIVKATCRADGAPELLTANREARAGVQAGLRAGSRFDLSTELFAVGLPTTPDDCELALLLEQGGDHPVELGTHCWSAGDFHDGECSEVTRVPGGDAYAVTRLDTMTDHGNLFAYANVRVGVAPARETPGLYSRCEIRGAVETEQMGVAMGSMRYVAAGESLRFTGAVLGAGRATWCELTVVAGPKVLARRCVRGDELTDGGC